MEKCYALPWHVSTAATYGLFYFPLSFKQNKYDLSTGSKLKLPEVFAELWAWIHGCRDEYGWEVHTANLMSGF
jgi:hypothetical protein